MLIFVVVCAFFFDKSFGQRQPSIQNISVSAPYNIKVDGELKEWENKNLSAYNGSNRIYYVISNDDNNLYLTVRGSGKAAGSKILKEGIKFTVSHFLEKSKKNNDPANVSVSYPSISDARTVSYIMMPNTEVAEFVKDTVKYKKQIDSLMSIANKRVESVAKEIKIKGIKDIKDSVLSVYNNVGIKAAIHFYNGEPIVELSIPLKYLNLAVSTPFSYNIKLSAPPGNYNVMDIQKGGAIQAIPIDDFYRASDTDLWGEYILAKKP